MHFDKQQVHCRKASVKRERDRGRERQREREREERERQRERETTRKATFAGAKIYAHSFLSPPPLNSETRTKFTLYVREANATEFSELNPRIFSLLTI